MVYLADFTAWFFFGGLFLLGFVAIVGGFLHARRERLLVHAERMKALEMGRELPDADTGAAERRKAQSDAHIEALVNADKPDSRSAARKCFSVAVWVPVGCAIFGVYRGQSIVPWVATASISVAALICGTFLSMHRPAAKSAPYAGFNGLVSKPSMDPDAFDVAGRRGG